VPRSATARASLTVTPRTDAGADAARLLADRYAALADSTGTLRAALDDEPALADVSLDQLSDGTAVERAPGTATITVRVTLADRNAAAAAANAVVGTLVDAGAAEDLVDVARGAEATPSRAGTSPDPVRWTGVSLLLASAAGLAAASLTGRSARARPNRVPAPTVGLPPDPAEPGPAAAPAEMLDDLPGFLESPPGSLPAIPSAAPVPAVSSPVDRPVEPPGTGATVVPAAGGGPVPASRRGTTIATVTAVVVLVAGAVLVAVPTGRSGAGAGDGTATADSTLPASGATATRTAPTGSAATGPDAAVPTTPAPATATAAGALAFESVPLGGDGVAASVTFSGVVLEQRAVGLTVTYPSVSLTTDGRRSLAHVRLPTFNCLTAEPPADPVAAGCSRSLTEYADLADPALQVSRDGDRLDVVGLFPTYIRSNGSPPAYTGRAYQLTATVSPDGAVRGGAAAATGVLRIGLGSAASTPVPGVNVLQFAG
jgi:hypothetical protein